MMPPASETANADELVRRYVTDLFRMRTLDTSDPQIAHLVDCADASVVGATADSRITEGMSELVGFQYTIVCPHAHAVADWAVNGTFAAVLADLERRDRVLNSIGQFRIGHRFWFGALGHCTIDSYLNDTAPFQYMVRLGASSRLASVPHDAILAIAGVGEDRER